MNSLLPARHPFADCLIASLRRLAALPHFAAIVAENVYWASCESFLQSCLLWSFNTFEGTQLLADRERLLTGSGNSGTKPDLLAFPVARRLDWSHAGRQDRLRIGLGFAYLKLAWSEGDAWGSATIQGKTQEIIADIGKLRDLNRIAAGLELTSPKELLAVVGCVSIRPEPRLSVDAVRACETSLLKGIQCGLTSQGSLPTSVLESFWLVEAERVPSTSSSFASVLVAVIDVGGDLPA